MAKLETQINQIYLIDPGFLDVSLILYEEAINASHHLYMVAELRDLKKKSYASDLKKISEIILASFRANKKLSGEILFETALAQINQNLADLAHAGSKAWVGKLSCLLALRNADRIMLSNNGQTCAFLKRGDEFIEILPAEKRGMHPLKTFQNFTQGEIIRGDLLLMLTSNILDFLAVELLKRLLTGNIEQTVVEISRILQKSASNQAFAAFFLKFDRKQISETAEAELNTAIYAPLQEELKRTSGKIKFSLPKIKFILPSWSIRFTPRRFSELSGAKKFFVASFLIFLILFAINLINYGFRLHSNKTAQKIESLATQVGIDLDDIQSAIIYKDETQAFALLSGVMADYQELIKLDPSKEAEFQARLEQLAAQVNKISIVPDPSVEETFKHHPIFIAKSQGGFFISATDSNSISLFDGKNTTDYFLLNSLKSPISAISFWPNAGVVVATANEIFSIDNSLKQFQSLIVLPGANVTEIKTSSSSLYALNNLGQILKITAGKNGFSSQQAARGDFSAVRDFGVDRDIYLLSAEKLEKISGGKLQAFPYPPMTDPITNAERIFLGTNIYILEPNKKRVVIMTKTGTLVNQIYFPNKNNLLDLYIDEAGRKMYLLEDNRLLKITF